MQVSGVSFWLGFFKDEYRQLFIYLRCMSEDTEKH